MAPDLVVSALSREQSTRRRERRGTFSVSSTVQNAGNATAGASATRFFLSLDATEGSNDRVMTPARSVSSLAPSVTATGSVTLMIPSSMTVGTYFLLACADGIGVVLESNEANNCRASTTTIVVTAIGLVVSATTDPPAQAPLGSSFQITETTANAGSGTAAHRRRATTCPLTGHEFR